MSKLGPSTDQELIRGYKDLVTELDLPQQSDSGIRTRRRELANEGVLEFTGDLRKTSAGRQAMVWGVTNPAEPIVLKIKPDRKKATAAA